MILLSMVLLPLMILAQEQIHVVKKGDTLYSLSKKYGVTVGHIQQMNGMEGTSLSIGQKLKIKASTEVAPTSPRTQTPAPRPAATPATPSTQSPAPAPPKPQTTPIEQGTPPTPTIRTGTYPDDFYYVVARGDNLYRISLNHGITIAELLLWNEFENSSVAIYPGQKLLIKNPVGTEPKPDISEVVAQPPKTPWPIPNTPAQADTVVIEKVYIVQRKDTLYRIATDNGMSVEDLKRLNGLSTNDIHVGQKIYLAGTPKAPGTKTVSANLTEDDVLKKDKIRNDLVKPLEGRVLSEYGLRNGRPHKGIDIGAKTGTPIYAVLDGTVVYSGVQGAYGNVIVLEHPDFVMTVYAHNEKNIVSLNEVVTKGQQIATVGATGNASGAHLHFEYRIKGKAINPRKVLPQY